MPDVMQNRRTSRRIPLKFPVWFRSQTRPDELLVGLSQNISASGMVLLTDDLLEVSTGVKLFFDDMPGDRQNRRLTGTVTRTEIDEATGRYLLGVTFTDITEDDRRRIAVALQETDIIGLLRLAAKKGTSDLHLSAHHPPVIRVAGQLAPLRKHALGQSRPMRYDLHHHRGTTPGHHLSASSNSTFRCPSRHCCVTG